MSSPGTKLRVYNSLSRSVEDFVPVDPHGRNVNWYSCGPTVYDSSHLGHARSYISFDILRRVLSNYFGYNVFYVMNITDIDDKIIKRARQEYLFKGYVDKTVDIKGIISDISLAIDGFVKETLITADAEKKVMREKTLEKINLTIDTVEANLKDNPEVVEKHRQSLLEGSKDVLYEWLDTNRDTQAVFHNDIFGTFARKWENEYFDDMTALNVLPPDVLTRVSEYVPEIVDYIRQIICHNYAYESNGSVYFDVQTYRNSPKHKYAKLVPEAVGDPKALQEGEGELTGDRGGEKRAAADFALWKASRQGEPSWDSPWGKGRPGWHIECSAMASAIVGSQLDIHTGGVDLKFPHHDNEIAQSEAYFENDDWVKYFLHSGHLTIAGCKMSKSLKNFTTIKEALSQYSAAQLRMTFLLHSWKDTLDYSPSGMQTAVQMEKTIQEFFLNVKDCARTAGEYPKWNGQDLTFEKTIESAKRKVHEALCDNIDTRSAVFALKDLIGDANIYIQNGKVQKTLNGPLLKAAARFITGILRVFGVIPSTEQESFGFRPVGDGTQQVDMEELILPYVEVLSNFREKVRTAARSIDNATIKSSILKECDLIRDEALPNLGVRLEDQEGCPTVVKYVGREEMLKEKELREKQEKEREAEKQRKKEEMDKAQQEKDALRKIPHWEIFRQEGDKYSQFDDEGWPTHDKEGNPIGKSQVKKLQKIYAAQKKRYEDYAKTAKAES